MFLDFQSKVSYLQVMTPCFLFSSFFASCCFLFWCWHLELVMECAVVGSHPVLLDVRESCLSSYFIKHWILSDAFSESQILGITVGYFSAG